MYYELYIDFIFIINFVVNVYVLHLLNHSYHKTATYMRVIAGGMAGSLVYCICLVLPIGVFGIRNGIGVFLSGVAMLLICFRIRSIRFFMDIAAKAGGYYFLFGGIWIFSKKILEQIHMVRYRTGIQIGILGAVATGIVIWENKKEKSKERGIYSVNIRNQGTDISVKAFLDTGNHLYEPISQRPVCIISKEYLKELYQNELPEIYRVIPFQSVGKEHGIMRGYPVENMVIRSEGMEKSYQDIYVCVSDEISFEHKGYQMILHPDIS